jgi:hypothetical protein
MFLNRHRWQHPRGVGGARCCKCRGCHAYCANLPTAGVPTENRPFLHLPSFFSRLFKSSF